MTKELVEEVARVEREDRIAADNLFEACPTLPLTAKLHAMVSRAFATHRARHAARQRNEGIEAAAKVADVSAEQCDGDTPGGFCAANQARSIATAIRALKEPE